MRSSNLANGTVNSRGDVSMMLLQGTTIPCVLKTRVDSTYQGFTICQVAKDVYSANGKVLLIERGSSVFGEQNIQMSQGKARVAILWGKIETPKICLST
ncbi:TrbI/VirB10 family protein (plasmid) [Moraxella nonliquefaciens]|uniref:TrbI/VirB10 family protein n=1 Tax=Moraxella nonliquefaciens TaxID=478 RepID=A0A7T3BX89_MORNO|nr:TrbI/VirB10 family protein [Moraxella nonliquefaciens]